MKLYFNPKSRAVIAKWMLDECGTGGGGSERPKLETYVDRLMTRPKVMKLGV